MNRHFQPRCARIFAVAALVFFSAAAAAADPSCCGPISPAGHRLEAILDGMDVESHWLAAEHVNWETGQPDKSAD